MAGDLRSIRQIAEGSQDQQILVSQARGIGGRCHLHLECRVTGLGAKISHQIQVQAHDLGPRSRRQKHSGLAQVSQPGEGKAGLGEEPQIGQLGVVHGPAKVQVRRTQDLRRGLSAIGCACLGAGRNKIKLQL